MPSQIKRPTPPIKQEEEANNSFPTHSPAAPPQKKPRIPKESVPVTPPNPTSERPCIQPSPGSAQEALHWMQQDKALKHKQEQSKKAKKEAQAALATMLHLASRYDDQENYEEANKLYMQCLKVHEKILCFQFQETLSTTHNFAKCSEKQENYEKANILYMQCLEGQKQILGCQHEETLLTMHDFANCYYKQANYEEARKFYIDCVEGRKKTLGTSHELTTKTMNDLADCHYELKEYKKAKKIYIHCLEVENCSAENDLSVLSILDNLVRCYKHENESMEVKALSALRKCLVGKERGGENLPPC